MIESSVNPVCEGEGKTLVLTSIPEKAFASTVPVPGGSSLERSSVKRTALPLETELESLGPLTRKRLQGRVEITDL